MQPSLGSMAWPSRKTRRAVRSVAQVSNSVDRRQLPIGKGRIARPGKDLTLISYGASLHATLEGAEELDPDGAPKRG